MDRDLVLKQSTWSGINIYPQQLSAITGGLSHATIHPCPITGTGMKGEWQRWRLILRGWKTPGIEGQVYLPLYVYDKYSFKKTRGVRYKY